MTHSNMRAKYREILTTIHGRRVQFVGPYMDELDAPPYKVGKQFPYENQRRKRELAAIENLGKPGDVNLDDLILAAEKACVTLTKPAIKSPQQMETQLAYLGKNRHNLPKKKATHKPGRSQMHKSFRDPKFKRNGHSVVLVGATV